MRIRIILILLVAVCAGCGGGGGSDDERTSVVASFYPLAYAAEEVGGPSVRVRNLTPPGAEPHDLEATPGDVEELQDADLVLLLGHGFQPQLEDAAGDGDHVLRLLDTPGLDRVEDGDVHVWLDPLRYAVLVKRIAGELGRPDEAERLERRLRALDREYQEGLADCARREIVTNHAAFGYLADRYGLEQIPITGSEPGGRAFAAGSRACGRQPCARRARRPSSSSRSSRRAWSRRSPARPARRRPCSTRSRG